MTPPPADLTPRASEEDLGEPGTPGVGPKSATVETAGTDPISALDPAEVAVYSAFYKRSVPPLVAFLRWQGASLPEAADCVQETLLQALPPRWATLENPHAWCRTVASRVYGRRVASCEEDPVADSELAGYPLIAPGADVVAFERQHHMLMLVDRLAPRQRQVMAWTYDGATPSEIARELKMDPQTVRTTLRDARKALRRMMTEDGGYTT